MVQLSDNESERTGQINALVETYIVEIYPVIDLLVFHLKERYSHIENCHVDREFLLNACTPKDFSMQHQEWGLDKVTNEIMSEIKDKLGKTPIQRTIDQLEDIINRDVEGKKIKIGFRVEHSGRRMRHPNDPSKTTNAFVSDRNCDLLLHLNPIEGGGLYTSAVYERLLKLESRTLSDFIPHATITANLISPFNPIFPHVSSVFLFGQKELIRAFKLAGKYITSYAHEVGVEGGLSHNPSPRILKHTQIDINAFIADYNFHCGTVIGYLQDRLQEMVVQKGFNLKSERGPIASSANAEEEMVLHPNKRHLYVDARSYLKHSIAPDVLPKNRRYALQLLTNINTDFSTTRGVGLDVYFVFNRREMPEAEDAPYQGRDILILNDQDRLQKYFSQFDMRDPFVNPEISVIIGCKELFDRNSPHYMLHGIGKSIEMTTDFWRKEVIHMDSFSYKIPGFLLTQPLSAKGSRKVGYRALNEETGVEKVIKIFDLSQRALDQHGQQDVDHLATTENVIQRLKEAGNSPGAENIAPMEDKPHNDGIKINEDSTETKVTYLICEPYDYSLHDRFRLGEPISLDEFFHYAINILEPLSLLHRMKIVHLDVKDHNIGIKGNEKFPQVWLDDFEQSRIVNSQITNPNTCSIDTRPPEIHRIEADNKDTYVAVDSRIDVFQAGCLLYKMLVGWQPFSPRQDKPIGRGDARDAYERKTMENALSGDYSGVFFLLGNVPSDISDIVIKAMQGDPKMRHETASEMMEELVRTKAMYEAYKTLGQVIKDRYHANLFEHTTLAERMLLELYPNASFAERIAIRLHDNERERGKEKKEKWKKGEENYLEYKPRHAKKSQERIPMYIKMEDDKLRNDVEYLVLHHDDKSIHEAEPQKDPQKDLRLRISLQRVMDGDCLSFIKKGFQSYLDERGKDDARVKVQFTFNRMSTEAKKYLTGETFTKITPYLIG